MSYHNKCDDHENDDDYGDVGRGGGGQETRKGPFRKHPQSI